MEEDRQKQFWGGEGDGDAVSAIGRYVCLSEDN